MSKPLPLTVAGLPDAQVEACVILILTCLMSSWDHKGRQEAWLADKLAADAIPVTAFDKVATAWALQQERRDATTFGATL
jgi:hypothetical protein